MDNGCQKGTKMSLEINKIHHGDCLELMKDIPDKSIDCIICDLPYGTTECVWDSIIPFDKLWEQYKRIRKDNTPIVLFGSEPFSTYLRMSNIKEYRYDWIWVKNNSTGVGNCNKMPMKNNELISCFYKKLPRFIPQGLKLFNKKITRGSSAEYMGNKTGIKGGQYIQKYTNYPRTVLNGFKSEVGLHPTQKPLALLEYLIKTYSNEGDLILDNCSGSGTTAIACHRTNRKFICIEKDENYYNLSVERLKREKMKRKLF